MRHPIGALLAYLALALAPAAANAAAAQGAQERWGQALSGPERRGDVDEPVPRLRRPRAQHRLRGDLQHRPGLGLAEALHDLRARVRPPRGLRAQRGSRRRHVCGPPRQEPAGMRERQPCGSPGAHCASARSPVPCKEGGVSIEGVSRRYHSASNADWQPEPAAVTAWRYVWSTRSPAANTPGTSVRVDLPSVLTYPSSSVPTIPSMISDWGSWPIAMNAPDIGSSRSSPVSTLRSRARSSAPVSPARNSSTTYGVRNSMFSLLRARSSMIFDARNSSRRLTIATLEENLARKMASSMAESPPPTMIVARSLKNAASQVAQ